MTFTPFDKDGIKYAVDKCDFLKNKYVCNNCPYKNRCTKNHVFYDFKQAQKNYEKILVDSRTGIDIKPNTLDEIEKQIVPLIKNNKQSVNQVYINHSDILYFSKTTFYKYVDLGILSLTNSDLPKKIRYKKRKKIKDKSNKRELSLLKGRKYEDFIYSIY